MEILTELARLTLSTAFTVLETAMFLRAILSWFIMDGNRFTDVLYAFTEPVILPIRLLFEKLGWENRFPIDIPFMVTFLLLSMINIFIV